MTLLANAYAWTLSGRRCTSRRVLPVLMLHMLTLPVQVVDSTQLIAALPSTTHTARAAGSGKTLIGYAHNWDAGAPYPGRGFDGTAPYIRLTDFNAAYNVLVVAFADSTAGGAVSFAPKVQTPEAFKADIQVWCCATFAHMPCCHCHIV